MQLQYWQQRGSDGDSESRSIGKRNSGSLCSTFFVVSGHLSMESIVTVQAS